jgi:hypothetical protein
LAIFRDLSRFFVRLASPSWLSTAMTHAPASLASTLSLLALSGAAMATLLAPSAALADVPRYSPLPPPPPPPPDLAPPPARPVARPATTGTGTGTSAGTGTSTGTATTTSAAVPDASGQAVIDDAPPTRGQRPALDDERFTIAPLLGFGTENLELGVGVRAGKSSFVEHLWVGGTAVYHAGHSVSGAANGVRYEASSSVVYFGPEVGYDFEVGPVIVRPYGGIGLAALSASATTAGVSASDTVTKLVIWPGATVLYGLTGSRFFVGGDTRLLTVPGGPAFGLFALGGMSF